MVTFQLRTEGWDGTNQKTHHSLSLDSSGVEEEEGWRGAGSAWESLLLCSCSLSVPFFEGPSLPSCTPITSPTLAPPDAG